MPGESVLPVTLVAVIAGQLVCAYAPRKEALTWRLAFPGFEQQAVHPMGTDQIIIVVVIVLVVLFVLGYFGRGRYRG